MICSTGIISNFKGGKINMTQYEIYLILFAMNMVILMIPHLIMDWLLQKDDIAINKLTNWKPRWIHSAKYALGMIIFLLYINAGTINKVDGNWIVPVTFLSKMPQENSI